MARVDAHSDPLSVAALSLVKHGLAGIDLGKLSVLPGWVKGLKLGISTGIYGLVLTNLLNDVVLGEPEIRFAPVGLRVIDPDYINIMITGHQHSMFTFLQNRLTDEDVKEKARKAGAKGFKLVGCTCVGQDLQLRGAHYTEIFDGHAGNNYTSEAILATGGIDAVISAVAVSIVAIFREVH